MLSRVRSVCCFSKLAVEEKQKRGELEAEVLILMAKLEAAEADKAALAKQLIEASTAAEAEKAALTKQLTEVKADNDALVSAPSIRRTLALKVGLSSPKKMSPRKGSVGSISEEALSAPAN